MPSKDNKLEESFEPFRLNIEQVPVEDEPSRGLNPPFRPNEFHVRNRTETTTPNVEEHQFIPSYAGKSPVHKSYQGDLELRNLSAFRNGPNEDNFVSLRLGEPEAKRRKQSSSSFTIEEL